MAAQERDIDIFLKGQIDPEVIETYCEVESGAVSERPQLQAALKKCRETGAHLVCQKIDRVSRDVEFWQPQTFTGQGQTPDNQGCEHPSR